MHRTETMPGLAGKRFGCDARYTIMDAIIPLIYVHLIAKNGLVMKLPAAKGRLADGLGWEKKGTSCEAKRKKTVLLQLRWNAILELEKLPHVVKLLQKPRVGGLGGAGPRTEITEVIRSEKKRRCHTESVHV